MPMTEDMQDSRCGAVPGSAQAQANRAGDGSLPSGRDIGR
jgi:hypothetical protein